MRFQWISILGGQPIKRLKSAIEPSLTKYFCLGFALQWLATPPFKCQQPRFHALERSGISTTQRGDVVPAGIRTKRQEISGICFLKTHRMEHSRSGMVNVKKNKVLFPFFENYKFFPEKNPGFLLAKVEFYLSGSFHRKPGGNFLSNVRNFSGKNRNFLRICVFFQFSLAIFPQVTNIQIFYISIPTT